MSNRQTNGKRANEAQTGADPGPVLEQAGGGLDAARRRLPAGAA